jgi:hypothetical protein
MRANTPGMSGHCSNKEEVTRYREGKEMGSRNTLASKPEHFVILRMEMCVQIFINHCHDHNHIRERGDQPVKDNILNLLLFICIMHAVPHGDPENKRIENLPGMLLAAAV